MQMIPMTDEALGWLEKRGIDVEVAARYGVSSVAPIKPTRHCWIAFPHLVNGQPVHWTARVVSEPKPANWCTQQKGGKRCLWNQDVVFDTSLQKQTPLIITEGHMDALAFMTVGLRAVCSVPDGAPGKPSEGDPAPKQKYVYLVQDHVRGALQAWQSIILATDNDGPGAALFEDLVRIVGRSRCRVIQYPGGAKDANQALVEHGPEALIDAVTTARWCEVGGIYELDALPQLCLSPGLRCGISGVDQLWRFRPGEMSVLTGVPGNGKTILVNQIGYSMAHRHQWVVGFFSPEQAASVHVERLTTLKLGKKPAQATDEEISKAREWIAGHVVWICEEEDQNATVEWLEERIATAAWRYNMRMAIIDPWNQLCHARDELVSGSEYVGEALRRLHRRCRESNVHILISAHPHKPSQREGEAAGARPPHGYAIADSAHFVNRPDLGATLHRFDKDGFSQFWCWKARYADGEWYDNGRTGKVRLKLDREVRKFAALDALHHDEQWFLD